MRWWEPAILLCAIVRLKIAAGAQDSLPTEPLCRAAPAGDLARVRTLLNRGANPNLRDEHAVHH